LRATGGGPPAKILPLTPLEEDIVAHIGGTTIMGDIDVPIPEIRTVKVVSNLGTYINLGTYLETVKMYVPT
jgi:hypothetical protein